MNSVSDRSSGPDGRRDGSGRLEQELLVTARLQDRAQCDGRWPWVRHLDADKGSPRHRRFKSQAGRCERQRQVFLARQDGVHPDTLTAGCGRFRNALHRRDLTGAPSPSPARHEAIHRHPRPDPDIADGDLDPVFGQGLYDQLGRGLDLGLGNAACRRRLEHADGRERPGEGLDVEEGWQDRAGRVVNGCVFFFDIGSVPLGRVAGRGLSVCERVFPRRIHTRGELRLDRSRKRRVAPAGGERRILDLVGLGAHRGRVSGHALGR